MGCGPGHLAILLARRHGFDVTGLDIDPAMVVLARANADRPGDGHDRLPSLLVSDAASLAFPDGSFETWSSAPCRSSLDRSQAGLGEIGRVLRLGGRARFLAEVDLVQEKKLRQHCVVDGLARFLPARWPTAQP